MIKKKISTYCYSSVITGLLLFLPTRLPADRIVITTDEYRTVRRIVVTLPERNETRPIVESFPDSGRFTIRVKAVDSAEFNSRKYIRAAGAVPIKLVTSFPDSQTMLIEGYTRPFKRLVSYLFLNENKLIFDVYNHPPAESFFEEKSIPFEEEEWDYAGMDRDYFGQTGQTLQTRTFELWFYLALGVIAVLVISLVGVMLWARSHQPTPKTKEEEPAPAEKEPVVSPQEEHERKVRKVMKERGLTYDEANLFIHVTRRK